MSFPKTTFIKEMADQVEKNLLASYPKILC